MCSPSPLAASRKGVYQRRDHCRIQQLSVSTNKPSRAPWTAWISTNHSRPELGCVYAEVPSGQTCGDQHVLFTGSCEHTAWPDGAL